jgi:hypothetical protein
MRLGDRIRRGPAQRGQTRISIANTRRRSRAHGHRLGARAPASTRASSGAGGTIADLQRAREAIMPPVGSNLLGALSFAVWTIGDLVTSLSRSRVALIAGTVGLGGTLVFIGSLLIPAIRHYLREEKRFREERRRRTLVGIDAQALTYLRDPARLQAKYRRSAARGGAGVDAPELLLRSYSLLDHAHGQARV